MSYSSCSQASTINTPDVSKVSLISYRMNSLIICYQIHRDVPMYYNNLLSLEENNYIDEHDVSEDFIINHKRKNENQNFIDLWGGDDSDDICLEALERFIWGEEYVLMMSGYCLKHVVKLNLVI